MAGVFSVAFIESVTIVIGSLESGGVVAITVERVNGV